MLKTSSKEIKGFLLSDSSVTVYSAIAVTPIVLSFASRFAIPQLPTWLFLIILGFIAFLLSSTLSGYPQAIVKGIALGIFINALFATRFGAQLSARIGQLTTSG